jgi:hypothetical protein
VTTAATRRRRRDLPGDVEDEVRKLALGDWSPPQIHLEVKRRFPKALLPSLRTVQRMVKEMTPSGPDEPWDFREASSETGPAIMAVIREVIDRTEGRESTVSKATAAWVGHISRVAPDLHPWSKYVLSRNLVLAEQPEPPAHLADEWPAAVSAFLAFAPWRSRSNRERYERAARHGDLPGLYEISVGDDGLIESILSVLPAPASAQREKPHGRLRNAQRSAQRGQIV